MNFEMLLDRRRIAVIPIRGVIGGAVKTAEVQRFLEAATKSDRVKAVVLDIDSPGGSATASESIYLAVKKLAESKPTVAWIRSTGASGAYFIACGASKMLTFPGAIVGSIGVISVRPMLAETLRRVGAQVLVTKTGQFKDLGAPWREPTQADHDKEQALINAIFERFKAVVSKARGFDEATMQKVTTGEVWLGDQAVEIGLFDETCNSETDAIAKAQELADLPHAQTIKLEGRKPLWQRLGLAGATLVIPGTRWLTELEGWSRIPQIRF